MLDVLNGIQNYRHMYLILLKGDSRLRRNSCTFSLSPGWVDELVFPENRSYNHKLFSSEDS